MDVMTLAARRPVLTRLAAAAAALLATVALAVPAHAAPDPASVETTVEMVTISGGQLKDEPSPFGDGVGELMGGQRVLASEQIFEHDASGLEYRVVRPVDGTYAAGFFFPSSSLAPFAEKPAEEELTSLIAVPDPDSAGFGIWGSAVAGALTDVTVYSQPSVLSGSTQSRLTPGTILRTDLAPVVGEGQDGLFGTRSSTFIYVASVPALEGEAGSVPFAGWVEQYLILPLPTEDEAQKHALTYRLPAPLRTADPMTGAWGVELPAGTSVGLVPALGDWTQLLVDDRLVYARTADIEQLGTTSAEEPTEEESDLIDRTQERCLREGWSWCDGVDDEETTEPTTEDPATAEPTEEPTDDAGGGWVDRFRDWWDRKTDDATEVVTRPARIAAVATHTGLWALLSFGLYAGLNATSRRRLLADAKGGNL